MALRAFFLSSATMVALLASSNVQAADSGGQADLNKATEAKVKATTPSDLTEVIQLAESAMQKGLDATNTEFAKRLLGSAYFDRAQETAKQLSDDLPASDFQQRRQLALADVEKSLKNEPKQAQAHLLLAKLKLFSGSKDIKEVLAALNKAIEYGSEDPVTKARALLFRAALTEQPDKKLSDLDEAVTLMPEDASFVYARGKVRAELGKLQLALQDFERTISLVPDNSAVYESKALVLARLKKYDEAIAALDKARQLNPQTLGPLLLRAGIYEEKGDKRKALADLDEAVRLKPDAPTVIRARALLLVQNGRVDEAVSELEKLAKRNPKDSATLFQLALFYGMKKDSAKAIETYQNLLKLAPDDWQVERGLADALLNVGRQAEAIRIYEKALKAEPKDQGLLNNLAWVLCTSPDDKLRNGRRALELATEVCKRTDYKLPHILSTLAAAYAETGDFDNAIKWINKGLEIAKQSKPAGKDDQETSKETIESLQKELVNYQAKKPTRELLSEGKAEAKAAKGK
jgi:tetratricopeptide (TPR) repeat protein